MSDQLAQFNKLIADLLEFGEDRKEMTFWKNIFSTMSASEQAELLGKLQQELETLKKISNGT